jgi:hypothetical protein
MTIRVAFALPAAHPVLRYLRHKRRRHHFLQPWMAGRSKPFSLAHAIASG